MAKDEETPGKPSKKEEREREQRARETYRAQVAELAAKLGTRARHPDPEVRALLLDQLARLVLRFQRLSEDEALGKVTPEVQRAISAVLAQQRGLMRDLGMDPKESERRSTEPVTSFLEEASE